MAASKVLYGLVLLLCWYKLCVVCVPVHEVRVSCVQDYVILCLDTGPSMDTAPLDEGETRLETAVKISSRIVQQKVSPPLSPSHNWTEWNNLQMFAGSKDYVGLVLFGTTGQLSGGQQERC